VLRLTAIRNGSVELGERKVGAWAASDAHPFLVCRGDFMITRGNGSLALVGRGGLVRQEPDGVAFPDTMIRARPRRSELLPEYLALVWESPDVRAQVERAARTSAGIYKVSQPSLGAVRLPVPSIDEQRRIVAILEEHLSDLDDATSALTRAEKRLWVLRDLRVAGHLTGNGRPEEHSTGLSSVGTHDGDLPLLPVGWSWSRLGNVAEVVGGVTKDSKKQSDPALAEVPYLRVANVQRGRLDLSTVTTIRVPEAKARSLALRSGDVLLNEGGDRDKLARGWVWEGQIEHCIHQNHVLRARVTDARLDPYFLSMTANSFGAKWAERNGKQSVNLASISLSMIKKMPVIVPAPGEARRVVEVVRAESESFDRTGSEIRSAVARSVALRRSLLAAAFSGRLTGHGTDTDVIEELAQEEPA
jgi:type I restriction enzyme S subunit